jgi:hypothetical protein
MAHKHARFALVVIASAAALVFAACHNGAKQPPVRPGRLPRGVTDAASLRAWLARYPAGQSHVRKRKGTCHLWSCNEIDVLIEARGITSRINPLNGPRDDIAVARLVNQGDDTESYYHLGAHQEGVLSVGRTMSGKAEWTMLRTLPNSNAIVAEPAKDLNYCHLYVGQKPDTSDADFAKDHEREHAEGNCDVKIPQLRGTINRASMFQFPDIAVVVDYGMALLAAYARSDGGWIECSNGCCT